MSFVFPALLATTILAGIPVLLHLILRQKPKSLPFPAFRFLVVRHQTNQRKLQLRHWLLLALRILLIALLIAAIARPRLLQDNLGLSSERPVAAVFVIGGGDAYLVRHAQLVGVGDERGEIRSQRSLLSSAAASGLAFEAAFGAGICKNEKCEVSSAPSMACAQLQSTSRLLT